MNASGVPDRMFTTTVSRKNGETTMFHIHTGDGQNRGHHMRWNYNAHEARWEAVCEKEDTIYVSRMATPA